MERENELSREIIGASIEVHRALGPGLLESAYEKCLCHELTIRDLSYQRQKSLPIIYKDIGLNCGYRIDLVVADKVIIELKAVSKIEPIHDAQLLTYLRLSNLKLGLLINFNVPILRSGIKRVVNGL